MTNIILVIKRNRHRIFFCLSFIFLSVAAVHSVSIHQRELQVIFLDVGQGDSALVSTAGGQIILIDGGPDDLVLRRLGEVLPFYQRHIDLIIVSHYHDDHITGLVNIIKRFRVNKIIYAPSSFDSPILEELLATARHRRVQIFSIKDSSRVSFTDGSYLDLYNPASLGVKPDANNSLVVKFNCRGDTFLFSGDNSELVERALIYSGWGLSAKIYKVSHHGSDSANSEKFLEFVNPEAAVISVGKDNKFGHPSPEVIERLDRLGIRYKRTDKQGNISIISP